MTRSGVDDARRNDLFRTLQQALSDSPELAEYWSISVLILSALIRTQCSITGILTDLIVLLREHQLSLPSDLILLVKALIILEGLGRQLDPDFDIVSEVRPFLSRSMLLYVILFMYL